MSTYLLFLILGLGSGGVYAILALGLVLKFKSSGVIDFSHGAVAMFSAYVFLLLRTNGTLEFPWILIPHSLRIGPTTGLGLFPSLAIALAYSALLGLACYVLVYRTLRHAPPLARVGASVGVMLFFESVAVLNYGNFAVSSPPILPATAFHFAGLVAPSSGIYLAGITIVIGIILSVVYHHTRFGLTTRAVAENEKGTSLLGYSASRISAYNWVLATVLAAVAGILIVPISTLGAGTYTLFVVPAIGVALVARFNSFSVAVAAGLGLGMFQSELVKIQTVWTWLPQQGLEDGLPFVIIIIAITFLAKRIASRGSLDTLRNASVGRPTRPLFTGGSFFLIGAAALLLTNALYRSAFIASLITACICMSVVVVTGYVGQISLVQAGFAGISGFMLSHIEISLGLGFPFGTILAALFAGMIGIIIGLPAVRVRGVNLAIATLAAAAALDALVFNSTWFSGGFVGSYIAPPRLFGFNLGISKDGNELVFGFFVLIIVILVGVFIARLRIGPAGRMFLAVRSNERAAASIGIDVAKTKLLAFGLAATIAGVGGSLLAYQDGTIDYASFTLWTSLSILALAYVGGVGRISGSVIAGLMLASNGVMPTLLNRLFNFNQYQGIIGGLALTLAAVGNPDGISKQMLGGFDRLSKRLIRLFRSRFGSPSGAPVSDPESAGTAVEQPYWTGP